MIQKCKKCGEEKPVELFTKNKFCKTGYGFNCIECTSSMNIESKIKTHKTKHGKLIRILSNISTRCNDMNNVDYGGKGIRNFISYAELSFLWDRDNASSMKRPSIDRIDNNKNYELSNCRFIELSLNVTKDQIVAVNQLSMDGNLVKKWSSLSEAEIAGFSHGNICSCCKGVRKSHLNYRWEYAKN